MFRPTASCGCVSAGVGFILRQNQSTNDKQRRGLAAGEETERTASRAVGSLDRPELGAV